MQLLKGIAEQYKTKTKNCSPFVTDAHFDNRHQTIVKLVCLSFVTDTNTSSEDETEAPSDHG